VNESERRPEITFFAGPNGSGKSTITEFIKPPYRYINADDIKRTMDCTDIEAANIAEEQRERCLENKENFSFETVLSTDRNLKLLQRAKEVGYFIRCFYILTADPIINVERIKCRVLVGGHDVPEEKVIARYDRALVLIPEVIKCCDVCHIYDNTYEPFRILKKRKENVCYQTNDDWHLEDIQFLTGIEVMCEHNLNQ